jgi:hypothetical protein
MTGAADTWTRFPKFERHGCTLFRKLRQAMDTSELVSPVAVFQLKFP